MPLKWKIYKWCCIIYMVCLIFLAGWILLPALLATGDKIDIEALLTLFILLLLLVIVLSKPILSLRFIGLLQKKTTCKNRELILFTILFITNIVYTVFISGILYYNIQSTIANWPLFAGVVAQITASVYLIMFDMQLKTVVYNANFEDISAIGNNM